MYARETVIINKTGLMERPAKEFVSLAEKFGSIISIGVAGKPRRINAKSIDTLVDHKLCLGSAIEIIGVGFDEQEAVNCLVSLIETGFGEV
jgi:phosphotransferase system HPr (HPr) family protein